MIWYCVYTNQRAEGAVHGRLKADDVETLYLHYRTTRTHARKITPTIEPYYPRYLFVRPRTGQSIYRINNTIGVHSILTMDDMPSQIPEPVMDHLRSLCDETGLVSLEPEEIQERKRYRPGQDVRVDHGLCAGLSGSVKLDKGTEISVWLSFFSGRVSVDLLPEQVSPIGRSMSA
jgi:transcriptional antiterminator RfaH